MKTFLSKLKRAVVTVRPQKSEIAAWLCFVVLFGAVISGVCLVKPAATDGKSVVLDKVVRLHVLANSDSDEDQALKLKVRDAIVEKTAALFNDCRDINAAKSIAEQNIGVLRDCALQTVRQHGYDYGVEIKTGIETYPVRQYSDFVFPAGDYFSVRVVIGSGKGKNWWCVLFPPLCSSVAVKDLSEDVDTLSQYGFSDSEISLLTEAKSDSYSNSETSDKELQTVVKFKLAEIFQGLAD